MPNFEYQVVPAPRKGKSARKNRGSEAKFANTIRELMNEMAAEGWEYQRAETLPCEERQGFTGKTIKYHSMLVFRREVAAEEVIADAPVAAVVAAPVVEKVVETPVENTRPEPVLSRTEGPASEGFMSESETPSEDRKGVAAE